MTLSVDVFWSFRSPYSYLAAPQLAEIARVWDVDFTIRVVRRLAGGPGVNGETPWTQAGRLEGAARAAGLDGDALHARPETEAARLNAVVEANEAAQEAAGHWGVPLMVFDGEAFFGQDRIEALVWRLNQKGLQAR